MMLSNCQHRPVDIVSKHMFVPNPYELLSSPENRGNARGELVHTLFSLDFWVLGQQMGLPLSGLWHLGLENRSAVYSQKPPRRSRTEHTMYTRIV